ncbi:hypothetical protein [Chryseobacterium sp. GP-SGM7]|uniref:hypothetical protein n=1 Tax=Chryseobacterium sp. GP-SGM7 TaxID=3411323 RepID=UPI003B944B0F
MSFVGIFFANGQDISMNDDDDEDFKKKIGVSTVMGHAIIKNNKKNKKNFSAPTLGINLNYWITQKWSLGLHSDLIFENFVIEENNGSREKSYLEREYPLSINAVVIYKPLKSLGIMGGAGKEFSKSKNLTMIVVGLEYFYELSKKWEIGLSVTYEMKLKSYDTLMIGLGITRFFDLKQD